MARTLIGSAVTDANGVASIPYTGTGAGKTRIIAVWGNDTLVSDEYELIDATLNQTGKTTGWYQSTLTLEDNRLKWLYKSSGYDSTSSQYVSLRSSALTNQLKGESFNVDVKIEPPSNKAVGLTVYYQIGTGSWQNVALLVITDALEHSLNATIPSTATNIWIRLQTSQNTLSDGDITYIDKFVVYKS